MFNKLGREEQVETAYEYGFDEGYNEAITDAINALKELKKESGFTATINKCITQIEWLDAK